MTKHIHDVVQMQVDQWYRKYSKIVAYRIWKTGADPSTVEDLTHDVFERAQRYLKDPAATPVETPEAWLIGIADNECSRFWKKKKNQPILIYMESLKDADGDDTTSWLDLLEDEYAQTERLVEERELVVTMNETIATFSPARLQAVDLHYGQGLSYEEIAVRSGRNLREVGRDARKGRQQLRKCWLDKIDEDQPDDC